MDIDQNKTDYTSDAVKKGVTERLTKLGRLQTERTDLVAFIATPDEDADDERIYALKDTIQSLRQRIASDTADLAESEKELREAAPEMFSELAKLDEAIDAVESEVRDLLLREHFAGRRTKFELAVGGVTVRRDVTNKTVVTYDSEAVLAAHPELADATCDGDPLFRLEIVPAIADRLIKDGLIPADVGTHRTESFGKNPNVKFSATKKEGA